MIGRTLFVASVVALVVGCDFSGGALTCAGDANCPDGLVCRADADGVGRCIVDEDDEGNDEDEGFTESELPAGDGDGTCAAVFVRTVPFTFEGSSVGLNNEVASGCFDTEGAAEAVFAFEVAGPRTLRITASDESGQGIAVSLRRGVGCIEGQFLDCQAASNGILDAEVPVEAGVHTIIVERVPSGPFSVSVE